MIVEDSILRSEEKAGFRLRQLYRAHGYTPFKMSKFEEYDLYVRNKNFLVSDNVITFTDTDGKLMALKPDVTLSIVKNTKDNPEGVNKIYYHENVYRVSEASHAYREIQQIGLECLGKIDLWCKAEVLTLAAESLAAVSEDYLLDLSHLGILSEAVETIGLSEKGKRTVLRCVGEKNLHGIDEIVAAEGADPEKASLVKALVTLKGEPAEAVKTLTALFADTADTAGGASTPAGTFVAELAALVALLPKERVRIDFSVVNDMNYYSGLVFKGFVNGIPTGVLSGGEYGNLMQKMGKRSSAIGFALYLDLLEALNEVPADDENEVVVLYDETSSLPLLAELVKKLTGEGKRIVTRTAPPEDSCSKSCSKSCGKTLLRVEKEEVIAL